MRRRQTAGAMGGVLRYVAQEQKTVDTDGTRYLTGVNCMQRTWPARASWPRKTCTARARGTWFYHYVQSFSAPGARHTGGGPPDRPGAGGAVLPRLRSAGGHPHRPGASPLPPGGELREAGHRGKSSTSPPGPWSGCGWSATRSAGSMG